MTWITYFLKCLKVNENRTLPRFNCGTCGNCETDFHDKPQDRDKGHCMRFKENVLLLDVNPRCWTNVSNTYYRDLYEQKKKADLAKTFKNQKKANDLKISLSTQMDLFAAPETATDWDSTKGLIPDDCPF